MTTIIIVGAIWFGAPFVLFTVLYFRPDAEDLDHRTTSFSSTSSGHQE
jgi:hypothetical protein